MVSFSLPTMPSLLSLLIPLAYLSILVGSMATFSTLYRRRQHQAKLRLAPYFPAHTTRDLYFSLQHLPDTGSNEKPVKVPESVLRAALLSRAVTDVQRILLLRSRKPALNTLLQRGVVGDEIYQRLLRAEQELEVEVKDVVEEANALSSGWGNTIFQSASEMVQSQLLKEKLAKHREGIEDEHKEWEQTRETSRKELMGEEVVSKTAPTQEPKGVATPPQQRTESQVEDKADQRPKTSSSDSDGVLVEPGDANNANSVVSTPAGGPSGTGSVRKKKKNKK